jgi:hypothetical protein
MEYANMGIIFIVKYFKQITMHVKPQADIASTGIRTRNRAIVAGICECMANIGFAHTVPESRLFELNVHLLTIAGVKRECKAPTVNALPATTARSRLCRNPYHYLSSLNRSGKARLA